MAQDKNDAKFGSLEGETHDRTPRRDGLHDGLRDDRDGALTLHEERLVAGTEKIRASAVRIRVKVVEEEKTVTVPVRREVLEIIELDDPDTLKGAGGLRKPREIVLHEERVIVETVPYERVTISREKVREDVVVEGDVAREVLEIDGDEDLHR
ncbi:hypothetical protein GCM10027418_31750 [Mariniluteicoccus endophyticus]